MFRSLPFSRVVVASLLCACVTAAAPIPAAEAVPLPENASLEQAAERSSETLSVGAVDASLESSVPAIAAGDAFGFTARVRADSAVSYLQVRLKVFRPTGRLIFQRTRIENRVQPGTREFHFERQTDDLDLRPGTYPVELAVTVEGPDGRLEDVIATELRVYDPAAAPTDLVMVARVTGQPLAGPDGRFADDPARYSNALEELDRIVTASAVNDLRVTLSVAPMLLEEWKRISEGYEVTGPDGVVEVPEEATVPSRYADVLRRLGEATDAGRIELLSTGYSDPDLSELAAHGLRDDVAVQYQRGLSAAFASLESTPSTGSAPAGGCVPAATQEQLAAQDLGYLVVEARCVRRGDTTVTAGVYRALDSSLTVLVADKAGGEAAAAGDVSATIARAFGRHIATSRAPFVFVADIGPTGRGSAEGFIRSATGLQALPWLRPRLGREVAARDGAEVRLVSAAPDRTAPPGFWDAVVTGRRWAEALAEAAGGGHREVLAARTSSLVAESAGWAHAEWALAARGQEYAAAAEKAGRALLDPVTLDVESITLAGTDGDVPVTISNGSDIPLEVRVTSTPRGNLRLAELGEQEMALQPQENFFAVPVKLQNALTGELTVTVRAGDVVLEEKTVTVRASYIDRLVLIGGVVALLGGLLAYIIRRVSRAEARVPRRHGRYTDATQEPPTGSDS